MIKFRNYISEQATSLFDIAYSIAKKAHANQKDKSGSPYINHINSVIEGVSKYGENARIVAALHDVLEDTSVTSDDLKNAGIPDNLIHAIQLLSFKETEPLETYYKRIRSNPIARVVKLADLANNSSESRLNKLPEPVRQRLRTKYQKALSVLECFIFDEEEVLESTQIIIEREKSALKFQPWKQSADQIMKGTETFTDDQKSKRAEQIYKITQEYLVNAKREYVRLLERVADNTADKVLVDTKSLKSFIDKVVLRGKDAGRITDILRGAILVAENDDVMRIAKNLKRFAKIAEHEVKQYGQDKKFGYYGSHHFLVEVAGILAEIQVMTKKLWTYKHEAHLIYTELRSAKNGAFSDEEIKRMINQSKHLFMIGNKFSR